MHKIFGLLIGSLIVMTVSAAVAHPVEGAFENVQIVYVAHDKITANVQNTNTSPPYNGAMDATTSNGNTHSAGAPNSVYPNDMTNNRTNPVSGLRPSMQNNTATQGVGAGSNAGVSSTGGYGGTH